MMNSLSRFTFRFTPKYWSFALALLFIGLFLRLGFWQLQRAEEKTQLIAAQKQQQTQKPLAWKSGQTLPQQYQNIQVKGHYLPQIFLLDNQHHDHQFGYDVLTPLVLDDNAVVLINRGWIPGDNTRQSFPEVSIPIETQKIQGAVYFPSKNNWLLGPELEKKSDKLIILEQINAKLMRQILQKTVYPFIIRLDQGQANGFVRDWQIVSMPPQRHLGYAVQWFAMALVIFIIFVALNLKKTHEKESI